MIKVAAYLKGIPPRNTNPEKPALLRNFIEGVNKTGDSGMLIDDNNIQESDVALIQGFVHENSKQSPHLILRKQIIDTQAALGRRSIIADSNLFLYADPGNTKTYLRYSFDGVFPNTGEYCNDDPDPDRWLKIQKDLRINLKPWRMKHGRYILICCQRDGGWSMGGQSLIPWLVQTITQLRRFSHLPIRVRFHPGDKGNKEHIKKMLSMRMPNISYSSSKVSLLDDFRKAHAVVTYNSSPGVAAAIEGVPVIVLDPERSQAAGVSHHSLKDISNLREFDREKWIQKIAQMHWTLEELKSGEAWSHMRKWVNIEEENNEKN